MTTKFDANEFTATRLRTAFNELYPEATYGAAPVIDQYDAQKANSTMARWSKHLRHSLLTSHLSEIVRFTVTALSILLLSLLFGCAASTADLVEQAQLTGDWSLVDKKEEARDRRETRREARGQSCGSGTTKYCTGRPGRESCGCVSNSVMRELFRSMQRNTNGFQRRR